eukprot:c21394_g1_i1 orf=470-2155(+)
MAEQGVSPHTAVDVTIAPPLAQHHGEANPSSSPHGSSFVKAIDRKARSYLKTLERSLSFSTPDTSVEDSSSMTIEFLRARLQVQRAEYKAEKQRAQQLAKKVLELEQRAQQLAKKVLELEQRLDFEIERRKKAERIDMLISPSYCSNTPNSKGSQSYLEREESLAFKNSKFKGNSSGEEDHSDWCSEISSSEGHPEGDGIILISPSSLRRHWETLRHGRQIITQNGSYVTKDTNVASVLDKESIASNHKELREKPCEAPHGDEPPEGPKGTVDLENTNVAAVATKFMPDSTSETLNAPHSIDSQSSRVVNTIDIRASRHKEPSEAGHIVSQNCPHPQASTIYGADTGFISESSQPHMCATKATSCHSINYFARPINNNCQNCQQTFSRNPSNPRDKMVGTTFWPQRGKYVQESHASLEVYANRPQSGTFEGTYTPQLSKSVSADHDTILAYIVAGPNKINEMQEEGPSLRQETSQGNERKYVKAMLPPHFLSTKKSQEISALGRSSEKLDTPHKNACPSAVQTRHRWKFHSHRMSLDGGLDRLQEAGRALEDDQSSSKIPK